MKHFTVHLFLQKVTKLLKASKNKIQQLHTRQGTNVEAIEPIPYQ